MLHLSTNSSELLSLLLQQIQMFSTHHILDNLILAVVLLDFQQVVAEIQHIKAPLLSQKHNDHTASPVQAIPKALPGRGNSTEQVTITSSKHSHSKHSVISHDAK